MTLSRLIAKELTRRHLQSLPRGANPVFYLMVLKLQTDKGYSRARSEKIASSLGIDKIRPADHYESEVAKNIADYEIFVKTRDMKSFRETESQVMRRLLRNISPNKRTGWFWKMVAH